MRFWYMVAQLRISLWVEPVAPPLNIADLPTRDRPSPFPIDYSSDFLLFDEAFAFFTQTTINEFLNSFSEETDGDSGS